MYTLVVLSVFSFGDVDAPMDRASAPQALQQGIVAADQGDWSKALATFKRAAQSAPGASNTQAALGIAESLFRQGRFVEASRHFEKLHQASSYGNGQARTLITLRWAQCLAHQNRWHDCQAVAQQALQKQNAHELRTPLTYLLGRCDTALGRHEAARAKYLEVMRRTDISESLRARAQWMIAHSHSELGETETARETFLRIEKSFSTHVRIAAGALVEAGRCYEQRGRWKEAEAIYQQAVAKYAHTGSSDEASRRLAVVQVRMDNKRLN